MQQVDPPDGEVLLHHDLSLSRLRCGSAYHLRAARRARTQRPVREASGAPKLPTTPEDSSQWQGSKRLRIKLHSVAERLGSFSVGVSLARIEPVGFRTSAGAC
jgi:hypothetical protein